ncbi:MAG: ribbon-helix-helix domain-containing protein [Candidatus Riflebacteria bacterium]|nr:ribbon-helix-helix domain-containing protein [Candidatus Riflebacteria bacterium]
MTRTQITLTEEQYRFLTDYSRQTGESLSSIIRRAVDRLRSQEEPPNRRVLGLIGAFQADRTDISVRHDEILWRAEPEPEPAPVTRRGRRTRR